MVSSQSSTYLIHQQHLAQLLMPSLKTLPSPSGLLGKTCLLDFLLAHWSLFLCLYADSSSSVWLLDIEVIYTQSFELFSLYFLNEFIQLCALNTLHANDFQS